MALFDNLRKGLSRSREAISEIFYMGGEVDETFWDDLEDTLVMGDMGGELAMRVTDDLREQAAREGLTTAPRLRDALARRIADEFAAAERDPFDDTPSCVLFVGINQAGGIGAVMENAKSLAGHLSLTMSHVPDPNNLFAAGNTTPYGFLTVVSTLAWGLGYFGMPHILLRFMAIEDENKLALSRRIASIWVVIAMGVAILIGVIGLGMTAAGVIPELTTSGSSETIIVSIAHRLSSFGFLPALLAGLILSGIMASTMSTADSQLLAASSSVSQDILAGFFGMKLSNKQLLRVARASLLVIAVIGVFLAWNPDSSVFRIVSFAWAGFGAAFGPLVLFSLFWRRTNSQGALAGMVVGGAMIFIWKFLVRPMGGILDIYELLPAFILSSLAIFIVSLLTKAPDKEVTDTFDQVAAM